MPIAQSFCSMLMYVQGSSRQSEVHLCSSCYLFAVVDVSDFIQFEIWDIPGQFKLSDIDAVATFSCTGTLIFIIDSQVVPSYANMI